MRVFITGATGFVGGWLAQELARSHPDAILYGTTHGGMDETIARNAGVRLLDCDLTNAAAVREAVQDARPDRVFHLAGFASGAGTDKARIFAVNVDATVDLLNALEAVAGAEGCRVHLASSGYVYGATQPGHPARETDTPAPDGAYAESKAAMERVARTFAENGKLSLTVTRAFNHTGPRQTDAFVVPAFARQIARIERGLEPPTVRVGNLEAGRDFLSVRDVVRAYRLLICDTDPAPWRVVNVASGVSVSIRSLLDTLIAHATVPLSVENDPARMRPSDMPDCTGDPTLLKQLTGWQPEVSLDETLTETLDFWREIAAKEA